MLSDSNTYTIETKKTLVKLQKRSNDLVKRLFEEGVITEYQRKKMIQYNCQMSRIYALPKIHKGKTTAEIPLRPIVSTIDGPASQLAILLDDILKPLAESEFDIKNSIEFTDKLKGVKLTEDEILASLDIITLFPNTPMNEVKTIILKRWDEVREQTKMSQQLFTDIFDFVTKEAAVFTWNETTYTQKHGCEYGSEHQSNICSDSSE